MIFFKNRIIFFVWFIALSFLIYFYPEDWMGFIILFGSFYVIDKMNLDFKFKACLLSILLIHQTIALYYFIKYNQCTQGMDFTLFHDTAKNIALTKHFFISTDASLFSNLIALFYKLNPSQLFGQELAVIAFMASCFIFRRIINYYQLDGYTEAIILIYALSPAALLWTSIILREPFELMFLMLAFENLLNYKCKKRISSTGFFHLTCAFILIGLLCLLHRGLFLSLPIFFIVAFFLPTKDAFNSTSILLTAKKTSIYMACVILILGFFITQVEPNSKLKHNSTMAYKDNYIKILIFKIKQSLFSTSDRVPLWNVYVHYRFGVLDLNDTKHLAPIIDATTNYDKGTFVPQNLSQFAYRGFIEYAYYSFLPALLINKFSILNIILSIIWIIRFIFFCAVLQYSCILYGQKVRTPIILLFVYFLVTFAFSLGTTSYGTAMRHNILTDWILILLGMPTIYKILNNIRLKKIQLTLVNEF